MPGRGGGSGAGACLRSARTLWCGLARSMWRSHSFSAGSSQATILIDGKNASATRPGKAGPGPGRGHRLAGSLGPALARSVDVPRATAILDALTLPAVYCECIDVHGWTPDEFELWLAATLRQQLLRR